MQLAQPLDQSFGAFRLTRCPASREASASSASVHELTDRTGHLAPTGPRHCITPWPTRAARGIDFLVGQVDVVVDDEYSYLISSPPMLMKVSADALATHADLGLLFAGVGAPLSHGSAGAFAPSGPFAAPRVTGGAGACRRGPVRSATRSRTPTRRRHALVPRCARRAGARPAADRGDDTPAAGRGTGPLAPVERLEQVGTGLLVKADPTVEDRDKDLVVGLLHEHIDRRAVGTVLRGVADGFSISSSRVRPVGLHDHGRPATEGDRTIRVTASNLPDQALDHPGRRRRLQARTGARPETGRGQGSR